MLLWCVHVLTGGGNEKKKNLPPPAQILSPGLIEGIQMELQIEMPGFFICSFQMEGVTVLSSVLGSMVRCS